MLKSKFNYFSMLITGLFFCVLGFSFIFGRLTPWNWLYLTFVIGISVLCLLRILNFTLNFRKLTHRMSQFTDMILWIVLVILSLANPQLFRFLFPRLVGAWIVLHAIAKIITISIKIKDKLQGWLIPLVFLFGDIIMAVILLFVPYEFPFIVNFAIGCYFLVNGGNVLLNFTREVIPNNSGEKLDNKIRLAVPPFMAAIIPPTLMRTILNKDKDDQKREDFEAYKSNIPSDLEVLVHVAPKGPAMLGHVDIIYRDIVLSYGCYDPHNRRLLGTLGDGVFIVAAKAPYLYNCLANENKILIEFGLALNEKQREALNQKIIEIFSEFEDFRSDEQLKQAGLPYQGECDDYISRVSRTIPGACFYKYTTGKFKTFFVLSSNCVFLITNILSSIGLNLVDMSGIIAPGSYYDFLNKEFKSDHSFVISRKVYTKKDKDLFKNEEVS